MSLVADVIASAKAVVGYNASHHEMAKLQAQSEEAKITVCQALSSHYVSLSLEFNENVNLHEKVKKSLQDISTIDSKIKDEIIPTIEESAGEIGNVTGRWRIIKKELEAVQLLLDIHTHLKESQNALLSNGYCLSVDNLNKAEHLLSKANEREVESQLEIISALREELNLNKRDVVSKVGKAWNKFVSFNEETTNEAKSVSLFVYDIDSNELDIDIQQMFSALYALGDLQGYLRSFGKNLMQYFVRPILCDYGNVVISYQAEVQVFVMNVAKPLNQPMAKKNYASAVQSLEMLILMFGFLNDHFSRLTIKDEDKDISLISLLGAEIGDEFIKLVLDCCLEESIPTDRKDLKCFEEVQNKVEDFHSLLVKIGFYCEDHKNLLNFVTDVEIVYGNKNCASILMKARKLMVKSLDLTATITPLSPEGPLIATDQSGQKLKETNLRLRNLSPNTFNLPKCQISVSVCELVNLIYKTLEEACTSNADFAWRLFHIVRNILSMYLHIIPTAHAHTLETTPEHAALIHNNSFLVAHHALLLGHSFKNRLPASLKDSPVTTVDLGYLIRNLGCDVFLKSLQKHKIGLSEQIREGFESSAWKQNETLVSPLQLSVHECVKRLQRLRTCWQPILPSSVFNKAIGNLAGSLVEDFVLRIVAMEEISADDAIGLINVLNLLASKIPSLFNDEDEAMAMTETVKEVSLWDKMNELIIVLGASLKDLNERWSEGKGPLAHHFTPAEVKHLIQALFQNTDRRAELLARIR